MAEQIGTPGSNADSTQQGKNAAVKDKACPFCHQPFTSSSLGRHLDLYIKEKNPKPADGIHNVDEIRKLRGNITRRQPRSSMSRREDSTPAGTPGTTNKRSPSEADLGARHSPSTRRDYAETPENLNHKKMRTTQFNTASWHSTGVINDIPSLVRNGDYNGQWESGESENSRKMEGRRTVSRQMLAKNTFEQKQKLVDALDTARASELALREVLGSLRAANERIKPVNTIFDYDPLHLDFPALTLHCLSRPPTLYQSTVIPHTGSWTIEPPSQAQYEALRTHFATSIQRWRQHTLFSTRHNPDDEDDSPPIDQSLRDAENERAHTQSQELELTINAHLHSAFTHWSNLPQATRIDLWRLELARTVGRKSDTISALKERGDYLIQENNHLRAQVEQLSRLQQPREFRIMPPSTLHVSGPVMGEIGSTFLKSGSIGYGIDDKEKSISLLVKSAIGRWKDVVQSTHANGMSGQRRLDSNGSEPKESSDARAYTSQTSVSNDDGEKDAEMEVVDDDVENAAQGFVGMPSGPVETPTSTAKQQQRAPEAPMAMMGGTMTQSYINGDDSENSAAKMDAIENQGSSLGARMGMGNFNYGVDVSNGP